MASLASAKARATSLCSPLALSGVLSLHLVALKPHSGPVAPVADSRKRGAGSRNGAQRRAGRMERPKGFEPSTFSLGSLGAALATLFSEGSCVNPVDPGIRESGGVREIPDLAARCRAARTLLLSARGSSDLEPAVSAAVALLNSALASLGAPPNAANGESTSVS